MTPVLTERSVIHFKVLVVVFLPFKAINSLEAWWDLKEHLFYHHPSFLPSQAGCDSYSILLLSDTFINGKCILMRNNKSTVIKEWHKVFFHHRHVNH